MLLLQYEKGFFSSMGKEIEFFCAIELWQRGKLSIKNIIRQINLRGNSTPFNFQVHFENFRDREIIFLG